MRERFWYEVKIVTSKKDHKCCVCDEVIPKGARTLVESGRNKPDGFYTNYFHTNNDAKYGCDDQFIDVLFIEKTEQDKIKDSLFFGQISYNSWKEETDFRVLQEQFASKSN